MMVNKVCRLCLMQPSICFSLLEATILNMMEALTFTKVLPDDRISTIVCMKCLLHLKLAYNIQQKIKNCEQKYMSAIHAKQEMYGQGVVHQFNIKQERYFLQTESVSINEAGVLKTEEESCEDLVRLCEKDCPICGDHHGDSKSMNLHIRKHFDQPQQCSYCDKSFANTLLYRKHLLTHPDKTFYQCAGCDAKFQYKSLYDTHVNTSCARQKRISVLGLKSKKAIEVLLSQNIRHKHISKAVMHQVTSSQVFKLGLRSSKAIRVLLRTEQKEVGTQQTEENVCQICLKKFLNKRTFQAHNHQTKVCSVCSREISAVAYRRHMEDHTLGPQVCHLCGVTLRSKNTFVSHMFYLHSNLRYKCEECGKMFQKRSVRDLHQRRDHLGNPTLYCDSCGKGFYTRKFLDNHIKMRHLKLRPHICDFCQKGFSSKYALKTHRRRHTNETPYRCEVCGEGFRQNVSLRAHKKTKHNIVEVNTCQCKVCGKGFASDVALFAHMRLH